MRSRSVMSVLTALLLEAWVASAQVASPTIEGPIPGSPFIQTTTFNLATVGYMQEEYFISGTATGYTNAGDLGVDGKWTVTPASTAAFKTRIVVYRPTDASQFNGTVVVEWLNVSGGVDAGPDWTQGHVQLIRDGFAWVGVSAQYVGVEGGPALVGVISLPLKLFARYSTLSHPGDSFSYDIYSQAGAAVRNPSGPRPLGDLEPKQVIAIGESQSAFRMVTYANAIHPVAHVYDGYFIHSRGALGADLSEAPQPAIHVPGTAAIRSDLGVPVLTFETETDLTFLGYSAARQADTKQFRLWEVAGTAHYDTYGLSNGGTDVGTSPAINDLLITASPIPGLISCSSPINAGPQHFVVNAALAALDRWVRRGKPPKAAPRLQMSAGPPVAVEHDANGVAQGGVRTPQVDAPIAAFTGEQSGGILCRLFGTTTPFDDAKLTQLYRSHSAFVAAYDKAIRRAQRKGFLVPADAKLLREWARSAPYPG
jgi:alpha/beta hydrolase family protein